MPSRGDFGRPSNSTVELQRHARHKSPISPVEEQHALRGAHARRPAASEDRGSSASVPEVRVALLISGHLRDACRDAAHFAPLARAVTGCRELASCDLFISTWDVTHPSGPPPSSQRRSAKLDTASPALPCLLQIQERLHPTAVSIANQPPGVIPKYENATWFRSAKRPQLLPLGGLRAYVHAVAEASELKRRHCAVFACGPYTISVRLRPDLYPLPGKEWLDYTLPHTRSWPTIIRSARLGAPVAGRRRINETVFSCGSGRLPGDKSTDACFWGGEQLMDRVMHMWNAIVGVWLDNNLCWNRWRQLVPTRGARPPPPIGECGPPANCSQTFGCLVEPMLANAIERVGGSRSFTTNGTGSLIERTPFSAELHATFPPDEAFLRPRL